MIEFVLAAGSVPASWSAAELIAESPEDEALIGERVGVGVNSGGDDGAVIIGTPEQILAYLDRAARLVGGRVVHEVTEL